eukprot:PhM_4_TR3241/c0_g1_i1/m.58149
MSTDSYVVLRPTFNPITGAASTPRAHHASPAPAGRTTGAAAAPFATSSSSSANPTPRRCASASASLRGSSPSVTSSTGVDSSKYYGTGAPCGNSQFSHWCGTGKGAVPLRGGRKQFEKPVPATATFSRPQSTTNENVRPATPRIVGGNAKPAPFSAVPADFTAKQCEGIRNSQRYRNSHKNDATTGYYGAGLVPEYSTAQPSSSACCSTASKQTQQTTAPPQKLAPSACGLRPASPRTTTYAMSSKLRALSGNFQI